ncbi:MAG TPA: hypothetical protein VF344_00825 [Candidatus Limnocylindrales bacterium]
MRRLVVASAILATLLIAPLARVAAAPQPSAPPTDSERATAALQYLWAAQQPDGSLDKSLGETADFVIGTADAGYDPATLRDCSSKATALDYLAAASDAAAGDAAKTGKTILAVLAAGADPASFAGRNLSARLAALYHSGTGAYGDGSTFSQSFGVLAVAASGGAVPAEATNELKALQDSDGSWSYGTVPVTAGNGDTNSTAIALMALDRAGVHAADAAALGYLHTQQLADGGFPYQNSSVFGPPASDPDSDSIVLQALVAAGQNPESSTWLQGGNSVLTHLRTSQAADGGFAYPGGAPDAFTTSQVPAALMRIPYAGPTHFMAGRSLPAIACPSPSPSPSPTASPSPSPTATPSPTPTRTPTPTAKPVVRVTAKPTVDPTATTLPPTVGPAASPTEPPPTPAATAEPTQTVPAVAVAGATSTQGDQTPGPAPEAPSPLLYGTVAILGLAVVLGGGWLYINRPWTR